jgi:hypothetical protein
MKGLNIIDDYTLMTEEDCQKAIEQQKAHPWLVQLIKQNKENIYDLPRKAVSLYGLTEEQIQECLTKGEQLCLKCSPPQYTPYYSTTEIKASQAYFARQHAETLSTHVEEKVCDTCGEQED